MQRVIISLAVLGFAAFMVAATAWMWMGTKVVAPGPLAAPVQIVIEPGSGLREISTQLAKHGVVDSELVFGLKARLTGDHRKLKAGEYEFPPGVSIGSALKLLVSGATVVRRLTIAEGLGTAEVISAINAAPGLKGEISSTPGEGALLPETYHYSWGDSRDEIVARMALDMEKLLAAEWAGGTAPGEIKTPEQLLVLASIVEKETSIDDERPRVAAVFINRLRAGMRLQSDPTVVYALTNGRAPLGRELTRADLGIKSPYNTYTVHGLPPGPIANPGAASIRAVMNPAKTDELYFVASGDGGHVFARTLKEHNRNVAKWRKIRNGG